MRSNCELMERKRNGKGKERKSLSGKERRRKRKGKEQERIRKGKKSGIFDFQTDAFFFIIKLSGLKCIRSAN